MDTDYWHSLDRKSAQDVGISPDFISVSTHPFKEQLDELKAKIFSGTKNVELSFIATGSGSRAQGQGVPEHYGKEEREELRQLAKINEIELTVHNPASAPPLSGFSQRGFSPEVQQESLKELKRTIEFAADVARGGSVTVHTQEFQRPIFEAGEKFEGYEKEKEKAPLYFVDDRTGELKGYNRGAEVPLPKKKDPETGLVTEWENKRVYDLEREAKQKGQDPSRYIFEFVKKKELEFEQGQALEVATKAKKIEEEYNFLKDLREKLENKAKTSPEEARYNAMTWVERLESESKERLSPRQGAQDYQDFLKNPIKYLKKIEDRYKKEYDSATEISESRQIGVKQLKEEIEHTVPIEKYALERTADTVAKAALYALEKENAIRKQNPNENIRPIVIAPENVFTQTYGSHPKELKNIIEKSREEMSKQLLAKKMANSKSEADQIAEERIKATFDIGHVNTWRQYFKGSEKEFNKYILNEISELNKKGIIGHVHINDNFGYEDIHISPGQGNAPIKEFVDRITKEGYKGKMVIEAGNQRGGEGWQVLPEAWRTLNSPVYRIDSLYGTWTDIRGSYFGKTGSPNYLVGDLAPSKEWTLWSETQFE